MKTAELFARCAEMATAEPTLPALRYLHETLVLACGEALRSSPQAFGNVFAQVDYLCKHHRIALPDRIAIQAMRRHSNGKEAVDTEQWRYDIRALCLFIAAIFHTDIPHELLTRIPTENKPADRSTPVNRRHLRCIVTTWDEQHINATTADGDITIAYDDSTLTPLLRRNMQLNLLDCRQQGTVLQPQLIVVEPDFLVDISAIAACFTDYGHHPISYTFNRLRQRANTQPILLGNFAGNALDDMIHHARFDLRQTLQNSFRTQALQFCTCHPFDGQQFKTDAALQARHLREVVDVLFGGNNAGAADDLAGNNGHRTDAYDKTKAILEPSFVCEQLGLQGRVDLMTTDMRLLVEQKSSKNRNIEHHFYGQKGQQQESHYVQLLLYYGILRHNFHLSADRIDMRLLYSRYPAHEGLLVVNFYQQLFREAICLRNRIVAHEIEMGTQGFRSAASLLQPDTLLENGRARSFFDRYIRPRAEEITQPLEALSAAERDYIDRMMTFVYREQMAQKVGVQEGLGGAVADLWNMPVAEKLETGNLLMALTLQQQQKSTPDGGFDRLTFAIATNSSADFASDMAIPNFRTGDMVYVYSYHDRPDVRENILYKGVIETLNEQQVTVMLNNGQQNAAIFGHGTYAIEHASSDIGTTSCLRSLHAFCRAPQHKRHLLLGLRAPEEDAQRKPRCAYHPHYDDMLQKAVKARDFFLLQGPPGTGKTSMALRFLVEEELGLRAATDNGDSRPAASLENSVLLMAYTNRAVDEICGMLTASGIDFLRMGSETMCDERFKQHLLPRRLGTSPRLGTIRQMLIDARVVVSTTSTLQAHPELLAARSFSLAIVDEASQILEPSIIGILADEHIGRFILVGDHKQLPAVVQQPDSDNRLRPCRQSLFERLLAAERAAQRTQFTHVLRRQGRMHPDVAQFANEFFYAREQLMCVPCQHQTETDLGYALPSEDALDELLKRRRVVFLPSAPCHSLQTSDKVNASEARITADLLRRIRRFYGERFDCHTTVGVIVPYRNQIAMIRREINRLDMPELLHISIDTVERYQGSQRDVIIYSFTVQQPYQLDFLTQQCFEEDGRTIDRKLNVAITRARKQLLLTGNSSLLKQNAIFSELIKRYDYTSQP